MRHGKYQARRRISPAVWVVLIIAVLGMSFGGVWAYLSYETTPVTNTFQVDSMPVITLNQDTTVSVDADYAVFLRAAVVVSWKGATGNILGENAGDSFTPGSGWQKGGDGFYYYNQAVTDGQVTSPVVAGLTAGARNGYTLEADVAVQTIQARGETDTNSVDAVRDAWGVQLG